VTRISSGTKISLKLPHELQPVQKFTKAAPLVAKFLWHNAAAASIASQPTEPEYLAAMTGPGHALRVFSGDQAMLRCTRRLQLMPEQADGRTISRFFSTRELQLVHSETLLDWQYAKRSALLPHQPEKHEMANRTSPAVTIEQAAALMRPHRSRSIRLDRIWPPTETVGSFSQLGGKPNLPPAWDWPTIDFEDGSSASLDFLAQINLEELPNIEARASLPAAGMLYFFALSQSNEPLRSYGSDAWPVLYYPGDAAGLPSRSAPENAGWKIDHLHYGQTPASKYRNPDGPLSELFPRCAVRFTVINVWDMPRFSGPDDPSLRPFENAFAVKPTHQEPPRGIASSIANLLERIFPFRPNADEILRSTPKAGQRSGVGSGTAVGMDDIKSLAYECFSMLRAEENRTWFQSKIALKSKDLPYHSDDAIMLLNEARNKWFENVLPIEAVLNAKGQYSDALLQSYSDWKALAIALTRELNGLGRESKLSPDLREKVSDALEMHSQLAKQARGYRLEPHPQSALRASLTSFDKFPRSRQEGTRVCHCLRSGQSGRAERLLVSPDIRQ